MNKFKFFALTFAAMMTCGMFSSCSNDDEPDKTVTVPDLPTPKYESESAKYEITTSDSPWKSIELTASGEYIVTRQSYWSYMSSTVVAGDNIKMLAMFSNRNKILSRAEYGGIISGKFIKLSDTEYILEGFGSIVIEGNTENAFSLLVTPENGQTTTVAAKKASQEPSSKITDAICRTWNIDALGLKAKVNNDVVYDGRYPVSQINRLLEEANAAMNKYVKSHFPDEYEGDDEYFEDPGFDAKSVTFTKAGTYLVTYVGDELAVSTWHWKDESKGELFFSWIYDNPDDYEYDGGAGKAYVSFDGNNLTIVEPHSTLEDGVSLSVETRYYCSESK